MNYDFSNDVVLVTGSSRGIGKGIAHSFAERGATVIINGVNKENVEKTVKAFQEEGLKVIPSVFDSADYAQVEKAVEEIKKQVGAVTVLVNNAGISPKKNNRKVPFKDMDPAEWNRVVDVNLNGVFNCSRAVINDMIEKRSGKIINISSAFARYYSVAATCHYTTTKTGVLGLTRAISGEVCQYGINCNAIAPGRAWTEMTLVQPKEVNEAFMATIPAGRFAEINDIANACLFLASENASYMHGATLDVNGGVCML